MKNKTISELLDELKETINKSADLLWEWEGCESYCDLLKDLVPMVDYIKKRFKEENESNISN